MQKTRSNRLLNRNACNTGIRQNYIENLNSFSYDSFDNNPECEDLYLGNFAILRDLGKGTFGKVRLCYDLANNRKVALKIIDKNNLKGKGGLNCSLKKLKMEALIMSLMDHPNICKLYEAIETDNEMVLVLEYIEGKELFEYIKSNRNISENDVREIFGFICKGIGYLHSNNIAHRDLKPENIIISEKNGKIIVKIIDLGFARTFDRISYCNDHCGSPFYASPEMILACEYVGPEVDIWSLGVILYVMLHNNFPFTGNNITDLYMNVLKGNFNLNPNISNSAKDLICRMLNLNRIERISIEGVVDHSWTNLPPLMHDCVYSAVSCTNWRKKLDSFNDSHPKIYLYQCKYGDNRKTKNLSIKNSIKISKPNFVMSKTRLNEIEIKETTTENQNYGNTSHITSKEEDEINQIVNAYKKSLKQGKTNNTNINNNLNERDLNFYNNRIHEDMSNNLKIDTLKYNSTGKKLQNTILMHENNEEIIKSKKYNKIHNEIIKKEPLYDRSSLTRTKRTADNKILNKSKADYNSYYKKSSNRNKSYSKPSKKLCNETTKKANARIYPKINNNHHSKKQDVVLPTINENQQTNHRKFHIAPHLKRDYMPTNFYKLRMDIVRKLELFEFEKSKIDAGLCDCFSTISCFYRLIENKIKKGVKISKIGHIHTMASYIGTINLQTAPFKMQNMNFDMFGNNKKPYRIPYTHNKAHPAYYYADFDNSKCREEKEYNHMLFDQEHSRKIFEKKFYTNKNTSNNFECCLFPKTNQLYTNVNNINKVTKSKFYSVIQRNLNGVQKITMEMLLQMNLRIYNVDGALRVIIDSGERCVFDIFLHEIDKNLTAIAFEMVHVIDLHVFEGIASNILEKLRNPHI